MSYEQFLSNRKKKFGFFRHVVRSVVFAMASVSMLCISMASTSAPKAVVLIYADDVGYGDLGCYGATAIPTPALDSLAKEGLRFTSAYSTSGTCTPSRYGLMTGEYPWRRKGTGILPGDAALIIPTSGKRQTLPSIMKEAGYVTGIVGKWHLGLGSDRKELDWNKPISPGPKEVGFDESFIIPATADRVPCVFVRNGRVDKLDPKDPISVSYKKNFDDQPTGASHPDELRYRLLAGHAGTIVDGISRIGFMKGGEAALWKDREMADTLTHEAIEFMRRHKSEKFFLCFTASDIHAPRDPNPRFMGKSKCGIRGDVTVQLDDCVRRVRETLEELGIADDTLIIFSSDNGPVVRVGYEDFGVRDLGEHKPAGPFKGMKGSALEGGCRLPFIVHWPKGMKNVADSDADKNLDSDGKAKSPKRAKSEGRTTDSIVSQMDIGPTLAEIVGVKLKPDAFPDAVSILPVLLDPKAAPRKDIVLHNGGGNLAYRKGNYKVIYEPAPTAKNLRKTPALKLYDLENDPGEKRDISAKHPDLSKEMEAKLAGYFDVIRKVSPSGSSEEIGD